MNKRLVFSVIGRLMIAIAAMMSAPIIVGIIYKERSLGSFVITAVFCLFFGSVITKATKNYSNVIYAKEGFVIVALAWLTVSVIGAIPFFISGEIPNYIDAFFESVSGYTTTGASVIRNVESLSKCMLFWRCFSQWIGGMGVLVFMLAFVSSISDRSIHILRAEMPGPVVGKLAPRSKDTSKMLYIIYIVMTFVQVILLWCGDMDLFESIVHSFASAGTGGFGIKPDSLGSYSPYSQWVITVFMFIFGINFNVFYLLILRKFKLAFKSSELGVYAIINILAIAVITLNILSLYPSFSDALRSASLQVVSISTTTGFASTDFNLWPTMSKTVLIILMFVGACAGSTAGGMKVSRVIMVFKMLSKEVKHMIHPRSVGTIKFEGKDIDDTTQKSVTNYFALYFICILIIFLVISFEPFDVETNITAAITCFNNVGPGLSAIGPMGSFSDYSYVSKILLSFAMLFGRLEIFPMLIALSPSTWKRR